ncbi:MAG: TolC family outer membrane protein [Acidibrevibacterium sp.]|uniref:TolC family outer membrane protein n=1 Tax=Acidibrevibacterium sp. TaxID=2606776 RepID=UPI003D035B6C
MNRLSRMERRIAGLMMGLGLGAGLAGVAWADTLAQPPDLVGPSLPGAQKPGAQKSAQQAAPPVMGPPMPHAASPAASPPRGEPPHTLVAALVAAYSTNPTLLSERAHLRSVDENVPTALAGWRPQVTFQGEAGYGYGTQSLYFPPGPLQVFANARDLGIAQANITQPLYTGGRVHAQTEEAENNVMAERAKLIATEQQVFSQAVNAYVTVIEDQQLLALNINNEQVLTKQLQATNDRFRVGEITRTDVAQAEAALAQARSQRETAEGTLQTARSTYLSIIGEQAEHLNEPQPLKLPVKDEVNVNKLAAANNPNVINAQFQLAAAQDAIDSAFANLMPTVSIQNQNFTQQNVAFPYSAVNGGQVTLNLNMPIYQGGSEYAAIRQARQNEQAARKNLDEARRTAIQQATQSWETLIAARAAIASDRAAVRSNQIALEGVEREAIVGSRTTLDVLNAQQALLTSQVTLVQDLANLVNASYNVAAAVGRLTARDLNLPVAVYDETAYYRAVRNRWFGSGDYATGQPGR